MSAAHVPGTHVYESSDREFEMFHEFFLLLHCGLKDIESLSPDYHKYGNFKVLNILQVTCTPEMF